MKFAGQKMFAFFEFYYSFELMNDVHLHLNLIILDLILI